MALSAADQVFAAVVLVDVVLVSLFDDAKVTAVDGAWSAAVAFGLAHAVHPFVHLPFDLVHEDRPFDSVDKGLPLQGHPSQMV